jgi:2,3-dihydroxy-p-cumate/2,3-dihydroxybenzoate 3,4-dioxygenase
MTAPFRYRRLSYVALDVGDLTRSTAFYRDLVGLTVDREQDGVAYLRCSDLPQNLVLATGDTPGLARVAFELESRADLDRAFQYLVGEGFAPVWMTPDEAADLRVAAGLRFREPGCGLLFEYHVDPATVSEPFEPGHTDIARLGHVVLNVADFDTVNASMTGKLGFVTSDHVPGKVGFLRAFPNKYHHSFAILKGPADGFNHVNFMVSDIDDVGKAINRMKKADVPIVFGPGRHLPSGSIFLYFLDPDGMTAEYSFGMEEFAEDGARPPRELDPTPEVLDTWGSIPDPRFGKQGAILNHA